MILFVNACVREGSRTTRLAKRVLSHLSGEVKEVDLGKEGLLPLNRETLAKRDAILAEERYSDPMLRYARDFARAEEIVVAAPYWDLSFPSALKTYLEHITVTGVTFSYGEDRRPVSHCRAKRLFYVMTAGGPILPPNHGFSYVRDLAGGFFHVPETVLFSAQLLDVDGADAEGILRQAEAEIETYFAGR